MADFACCCAPSCIEVVQPNTTTGASCCNATNSCLSTAPYAPTLGVAGSARQSNDVSGIINTFANLGVMVGSIATGRPIVSKNVNGQTINTLGTKPVVTGQVQASSILFVFGIALVLGVLVYVNRE